MQRTFTQTWLIAVILLTAVDCFAGQIKAYVAPFTVTGAASGTELKTTLQNLLMSRLGSGAVIAVDTAESADVNIKGSYVAFGKVFSIDAVASGRDGKVLVRAFEQGESQEEVLSAVGKLAKTLVAGIEKSSVPVTAAVQPVASPKAMETPPVRDIIRAAAGSNQTGSGWTSQKLSGELNGMVLGRTLANNERELFLTDSHSLYYYRLGKELVLVAQTTLPVHEKILGIDSADLDHDTLPEIYLTVMGGDDLVSEVWTTDGNALKKIAEKMPYFFRSFGSPDGSRKLLAQQMGRDDDYYGGLYEVVKKGANLDFVNPLTLPKFANIYNTNLMKNKTGRLNFVVLNPDGYLLVFDDKGTELWRSSDKYGGSESFFAREDPMGMKTTGAAQRKIFLEQRIVITRNGEIIVPKNDGFYVIGNSRSYSKNSIFAFSWNGVMLDELWHTKVSQNYLADYQYDEGLKELLLLEVVKKEGVTETGASAVSIKRVE